MHGLEQSETLRYSNFNEINQQKVNQTSLQHKKLYRKLHYRKLSSENKNYRSHSEVLIYRTENVPL